MANAKTKTETQTKPDSGPMFGSLITDLSKILGAANTADGALEKAKEKQANAGEKSIRAFIERASQINEKLTKDDINVIAEAVGDKLASGNANVKKSRKTEIVLLLSTREHASGVLQELDAAVATRDPSAKPISVRQAAFKALRRIRSQKDADATIKTPKQAVRALIADLDYVPSDDEKYLKQVAALATIPALLVPAAVGGGKVPHPALTAMMDVMQAAIEGDSQAGLTDVADTLGLYDQEEDHEDLGISIGDPAEEEAPAEGDSEGALVVEGEEPESDIVDGEDEIPEPEDDGITEDDLDRLTGDADDDGDDEDDEDNFDLESATAGLIG